MSVAMRAAPAAATLAAFARDLTYERMPEAARARTAEVILDLVGVATRGRDASSSRAIAAFLRTQPMGAAWSALAMAAAAHATEMDDVTTESSLHPGVAIIPAALETARERRASGQSVLAAVAAGYEATIRIGNALGAASAYRRGFHPTGVAGVFGAAVAAGKILGLDADRLGSAIGIAGTMASGSIEYLADGSWTKRLNPAWAAHGGIVAAGLAATGYSGPLTAIDGEHGTLAGYTDEPDPSRLTGGLSLDDLQVMHVSIKPYACCRYAHGIVDAALTLREHHRVRPEDVAVLRLGVLGGGWSLIADPPERVRAPRNPVDAQFSAPWAAAVAIARGRAGLAEFSEEALADPAIRDLAARAECYRDDSLDAAYPRQWPAAVEVTLRDGRTVRARIEYALGEPENPVSRDALVDRFVDMVAPRLAPEAARRIAARILALDAERDLSLLDALG